MFHCHPRPFGQVARYARCSVIMSLLAMGVCTTSALAGGATFQTLGYLSTVYQRTYTFAVSPDGSAITGESYHDPFSEDYYEAIRWTENDGFSGIGLLSGTHRASGKAISNGGAVVYGNSWNSSLGAVFRWTPQTGMTTLGHLPNMLGSSLSAASADGSIAVGYSSNGADAQAAFVWTEAEGMRDLNDVAGVSGLSSAAAISSDGQYIAGGSTNGPFRWSEVTGIEYLPVLRNGIGLSSVYDISADGSTIVGASSIGGAVRWTEQDGIEVLGTLDPNPSSYSTTTALGVTADGSVVVGNSGGRFGFNDGRAFIWDEDNGMRNLKSALLDDYGLDLGDWILYEASGISDDGTTIIGYGTPNQFSSSIESFVIRLPEPGTLTLFGLIVLACSRWR